MGVLESISLGDNVYEYKGGARDRPWTVIPSPPKNILRNLSHVPNNSSVATSKGDIGRKLIQLPFATTVPPCDTMETWGYNFGLSYPSFF